MRRRGSEQPGRGACWLGLTATLLVVLLPGHALANEGDAGADEDGPAVTLPEPTTATTGRVLVCSYEQCVQRALRRSPLFRAAAHGVDLYEAKAREARSAGYPKFSVTGFASALPKALDGHDGSNPFTDYDWSLTSFGPLLLGEVSVTQPVYTFGKIDTLKRLAAQGVEVGKATVRVAEDEVRYQVARAWWGLVLIREMGDMIADGRKLLREQREKLEELRDEGDEAFNQSDLLKLNVYTAEFEDKVRASERMRLQALDGLRMALDEGLDVDIRPDAQALQAMAFPLLPSAAYETLAMANHPKLLAMRNGVAARLEQVHVAEEAMWPDIAVVARLAGTYAPTRRTTPDSLASNPQNIAQSGAGLALRWNLDIFRNKAKAQQARIEHLQLVLQERGERDKQRMEVRHLVRELVDAREMLAIHEQAQKSARGWLNAENQLYEDGLTDFAEVLKAIETYYRRRLAWLEAVYNHNLAVAALSRAVGMDVSRVRSAPRVVPPAVEPAE